MVSLRLSAGILALLFLSTAPVLSLAGPTGLAYAVLVQTDPAGPVRVNLTGLFTCQSGPCVAAALHYSQADPGGGFAWGGSFPGVHLWTNLLGESTESTIVGGEPGPADLEGRYTFSRTDHGSWGVVGVITTGDGPLTVNVDPPTAVRWEQLQRTTVQLLHARDFQPMADVSSDAGVGVGAGVIYDLESTPMQGLFGWYRPREEGVVGVSSFSGPGVGGECMQASAYGIGGFPELIGFDEPWPPACRGWTLHAEGGPWKFNTLVRVVAGERAWGMWADITPPEFATAASDLP